MPRDVCMAMNKKIYPGEVWLDTDGKPIQAHGGSLITVNDTFYWYGENKEFTHGTDNIWSWGVRAYASKDLVNWKDMGLIIPPNINDKHSPLHPTAILDRPKIIFNEMTQKYVCWLKIQHTDGTQTATVLSADDFLGPYEIVNPGFKPLGMSAGDFDIAIAQDGRAYYYFERVHSEMICADLNDNYTDVSGYYSTHFPEKCPPYVREGVAYFERNSKKYVVTSGTTGYYPNPSMTGMASAWHGKYDDLGSPHRLDTSETSFHSQVSSVFKVPKKNDLYIALADRWLPHQMDYLYSEYCLSFEERFNPNYSGPPAKQFPNDTRFDISKARYVWLPINFKDEIPYIDWVDQWSPDDYE